MCSTTNSVLARFFGVVHTISLSGVPLGLNNNYDIHSATSDPSHTVHLQGPPRAITFAPLGLQFLVRTLTTTAVVEELR